MADGAELSIKLLNHASIIVRCGGVSLLCDPWFDGTCFADGWGLRFIHPAAMSDAQACSHLWVSHFHTDHLHMPTLAELARRNPNMEVLSNASSTFDTAGALRRAGFTRLTPLTERVPMRLAPDFEITRFPATGIDNMLLMRIGAWRVLNYNDCNLPERSLRQLLRKLGPVDILLSNFNHAGKLIDARNQSPDAIINIHRDRFRRVCAVVNARYAIPFASLHWYRSPYSQEQNHSMMTCADIAAQVPRAVALRVGDTVRFRSAQQPQVERLQPPLDPEPMVPQGYGSSRAWDELLGAAEVFRRRVRKEFFGLVHWIAPVSILIDDLQRALVLDLARGVKEGAPAAAALATHSEALAKWWARPYGTVDFQVGAHFRILSDDTGALRRLLLAAGLVENKLSPRSALHMLRRRDGWRFVLNRREEVAGVFLGRKFTVLSRL